MTEYDELPYDSQPIPATAPEQLAVVSLLSGGPVPAVTGARVLEVGCGGGANLLPQAFHRPDMRFVGIDTSRVHIRSARAAALELGLQNVRWIVGDAREVKLDGPFDYVVAHGVLSWVDGQARDGLLARCREQLAACGLLYVSYNAHPGWKVRGLVREVLRRNESSRARRQRVADARQLASFLSGRITSVNHPYASLLERELRRVIQGGESYVAHEYLAEHNEAFWLRDFVALAERHGLRYVAEAGFNEPDSRVPSAIRDPVLRLGLPPLAREELIDVLYYRQHRTSLFCREDAARVEPTSAAVERLVVASGLRPRESPVSPDAGIPAVFVGVSGFEIELLEPAAKAALVHLANRWPAGTAFPSLVGETEDPGARERLRSLFLDLFAQGQADLRLREPRTLVTPGGQPRAPAISRFEAARQPILTTPGHTRLPLEDIDRKIVARFDGSRACSEIADECAPGLTIAEVPGATSDVDLRGALERRVELLAATLGAWGLLES